jgi:hypothetical protein
MVGQLSPITQAFDFCFFNQRPVLKKRVRSWGWTLAPTGELGPYGRILTPRGERGYVHPYGDEHTLLCVFNPIGDTVHPWEPTSHLGPIFRTIFPGKILLKIFPQNVGKKLNFPRKKF